METLPHQGLSDTNWSCTPSIWWVWFSLKLRVSMVPSDPVNWASNTALLTPHTLRSAYRSSIVLQILTSMGTSTGDKAIFSIGSYEYGLQACTPRTTALYHLRLCGLCLKRGCVEALLSFSFGSIVCIPSAPYPTVSQVRLWDIISLFI